MPFSRLLFALVPLVAALAPVNAFAAIFVASGTNSETGTELAASASFTVDVEGNLIVTLTNTGDNAVAPSDVLTAVFFTVNVDLAPMTASLGNSVVLHGTTPADGNVGGEWGYGAGLSGAPGGAAQGISAVGFDLFGHANFNGPVLFTPPPDLQLGGLDAGLVSAAQTDVGSNSKILSTPLLQDRVTFTLDASGDIDLTAVTNVSFQFGTDLSLTNLPGDVPPGGELPPEAEVIPEPSAVLVLVLGSGGLALVALRRKLLGKAA